MSPEAPTALHADACPDAEQLAAYSDGGLSPAERTMIEMHLLQCADCRDVVGGAVALGATDAPAARTRPRTFAVIGPLILTAAAAIFLVARVDWRSTSPSMTELLQAAGGTRPGEPRLSVGSYAPPRPVTRDGQAAPRTSPETRIAAARIEKRASENPTQENLHALGIARLLMDDPSGSVEALSRAGAGSASAAILGDLAAALLLSAERTGDAAQLARAREVSDRALQLDSTAAAARFNGALAAERAGDRAAAIQAWEQYLAQDASSPWAEEARAHLARVRAR